MLLLFCFCLKKEKINKLMLLLFSFCLKKDEINKLLQNEIMQRLEISRLDIQIVIFTWVKYIFILYKITNFLDESGIIYVQFYRD